ncbi:PP2C family protein-serine/threonine phosphatase [Acidicapsa dinghuensis]|uniref:PP2C family protein-serine/threonine phosphatase n=1 Tax=Acidicapsa dinghuensis TaxID=2218256 RepID=A0ABW1EBX4_9BACT|nr:PP2C family protein-serine/threonine phosphatase [Acidicapsa dinghuensis]
MRSSSDLKKRSQSDRIRHTSGPLPEGSINVWKNIPRSTIIVFLAAVFFVFTCIGFAGDITGMGREPIPRFVGSVLTSGIFAIFYAIAGTTLRRKSWKAVIPIFAVQYLVAWLLGSHYHDLPQHLPIGIAEIAQLHSRLSLDATAIIIAVSLGYTGFVWVSVSEGRRYARARMEMAVLEAEMAAAREIQQVMLPEHGESFPGFTIDSIYKPAREVGGDFFQILPASGGLLIVFGDVAGKGLPAAMLVSMLVGSIRSIAEDTTDPVIILRKLHDRLLGRASGGFSTAVAARITPDGAITIANAGHLSPYLDGGDLNLPGALPLGIPNAGQYENITMQLYPGSRLTFVSDGVVEAQTATGELYGFDRTRAISMKPAAAIAQTAIDFGQADDITVVTIQRLLQE